MTGSIARAAVLGLLLALPAALRAQDAPPRGHGRVWGSVGVGAAYASLSCAACEAEGSEARAARGWETAVNLAVGGALGPRLLAGVEATGWYRAKRDPRENLLNATEGSTVSAVLRYYPLARAGLYLRGGAGVGITQRYAMRGDSLGWYDVGPSISLGVGYSAPIARAWALAPYATATQLLTTSLRSDVDHSRRPGWVEVGVALERR